ncbi:MAG: DUF1667 domain-containing protein [Defluviitaleaceae bacterium]|nr:DUF1667 domain-containing protein [Defluviitaleaceae bacterium]
MINNTQSTQIITCIGCPVGCELTVEIAGASIEDIKVSGRLCKIGDTYGKEEATFPTRNITTSVKVDDGDIPMLSVKNSKPIPKGKIMDCVKAVQAVRAKAPVSVGDIVLVNAADTGVDFVATRVIEKVS